MAQYCTLSDGRRLGFDQHGPVTGIPLFLFHGVPSSRLDWYLFGTTELTRQLNLRVIAVDRPGIGCSSPRSDARLMDWPADVATLADRLGLTRFSVLGYSGGESEAEGMRNVLSKGDSLLAAIQRLLRISQTP